MNSIAEKVYEVVKTLPKQQAAEVMDFVEFLKAKQVQGGHDFPVEEMAVTPQEHAAWVEQMRAITAAQPMTYTTVEDLCREARY